MADLKDHAVIAAVGIAADQRVPAIMGPHVAQAYRSEGMACMPSICTATVPTQLVMDPMARCPT